MVFILYLLAKTDINANKTAQTAVPLAKSAQFANKVTRLGNPLAKTTKFANGHKGNN